MSETETSIIPTLAPAELDAAVAAILDRFGDRVESVTVATVNGQLRRETTITLDDVRALAADAR